MVNWAACNDLRDRLFCFFALVAHRPPTTDVICKIPRAKRAAKDQRLLSGQEEPERPSGEILFGLNCSLWMQYRQPQD